MSLKKRLERLEQCEPPGGRLTFDEAFDRYFALEDWIAKSGYADAEAALAAGETGPAGFEADLAEKARAEQGQKLSARIMATLGRGELPSDDLMRQWRGA